MHQCYNSKQGAELIGISSLHLGAGGLESRWDQKLIWKEKRKSAKRRWKLFCFQNRWGWRFVASSSFFLLEHNKMYVLISDRQPNQLPWCVEYSKAKQTKKNSHPISSGVNTFWRCFIWNNRFEGKVQSARLACIRCWGTKGKDCGVSLTRETQSTILNWVTCWQTHYLNSSRATGCSAPVQGLVLWKKNKTKPLAGKLNPADSANIIIRDGNRLGNQV